MRSDLAIVEGEYLRDILAQPRAMGDTVASLDVSKSLHSLAARIRNNRYQMIVLTGMGSSFHALHLLHNSLIQLGLSAVMVETSELVHYKNSLLNSKNLIVAVSQSGQSVEIVRLLRANRHKAAVIAVTNTPESPLAKNAEVLMLTKAGAEFSVSCKTYVSSFIALQWFAEVVRNGNLRRCRTEFQHACRAAEEYLLYWRNHVEQFARVLQGVRNLFIVGRGNSLAAVGTGALIVKESAHFATEGLSSAAFRHGPLEMLCKDTFVLVFGGNPKTLKLNQNLLQDIREHGGRAELVSHSAEFSPCAIPVVPVAVEPILEILSVQMITLALAALAGREAGRFDLATKITTKE